MPPLTDEIKNLILQAKPITNLFSTEYFPFDLFRSASEDGSFFENVFYTDAAVVYGDNSIGMSIDILVPADLEISFFGLDYVTFAIGEQDYFPFTARVVWTNDDFAVMLENIKLGLRFSRDLLIPVVDTNGKFEVLPEEPAEEGKPIGPRVSLFTTGSLYLDNDFDFEVRGFDAVDLSPCKIPGLDMYASFKGIKLSLSRKDPIEEIKNLGFSSDFQGIFISEALIQFQDDLDFLPDITVENFAIGTGGISGKITATFDLNYNPTEKKFEGDAAGELFGAAIGLRKFEFELRANEVVSSEIIGQMLLPFFEKPVEIELSFDLKGNISVGIKGTQGDVLVELTKDDIFSMKINSFAFSRRDEEIAFALGGSIKPLFGEGIRWPEFGVNNLIIWRDPNDRKWGVKLEGGWIDFPKSLSFSVAGFRGELRKIGFGTIDIQGRKNEFVGFSGSISFVSGFALAAEFDDLQLFYAPNIRVELERARIGLLIPNTISLIGEVSKKEDGFGGMIDVAILPLDMRILGGAEFGRKPPPGAFSYMQILMGLELPPPGIMLGTTPLAIRGFEGKYAMNMEPSMDPGWEWAIATPRGIMPLSKMVPGKGGKMLGAGLKITTTDGWLLGINALFALLLPGPVVMIEGRGGLFSKTVGGRRGGDPPFYALIVINGREQYFSANLSFNADLVKGIVRASGTVACFFDFQDLNNWYVKLGQREPASKRITAIAIKIFKATAYFEVYGGPRLAFGADISIRARKNFVIGRVKIKIYIGGGVDLSWNPEHAAGFLKFSAEIAIVVFGFGLAIGLFGEIDAKTPYPRRLLLAAGFHFFIYLPWPLPDLKVKGKFKKVWKDGRKYPCDFEPLVSEVLVDSEIPNIPAKTLTHYDSGTHPPKIADVALVPMDARPTIKFAFPINYEPLNEETSVALAGNASNGVILHRIDDDEYKFSLVDLKLEEHSLPEDPNEFNDTLNAQFLPGELLWNNVMIPYGVFIADNSATGHIAATTLRLFSDTPFTHFRQTLFSGGMQQEYGLDSGSSSAAWLNSSANESGMYNADTFIQQSGSTQTTAANLAATFEDQAPEYPLGQPTTDWRYLGFADVPLQFQKTQIQVTTALIVLSAPDATGTVRPFDVIDLHFLPPAEVMPEINNIPTLVRGVYFKGAIKIQFLVPVSECELYLYPVRRESTSSIYYPDDWPDEGKPDDDEHDKDKFFMDDCCTKALTQLKVLIEIVKDEKTRTRFQELATLIEYYCRQKKDCCTRTLEELKELEKVIKEEKAEEQLKELSTLIDECCKRAEDCCAKARAKLEKITGNIKDEKAQMYLSEFVTLLEECCEQKPEQELGDDEPFLSFDFDPTPNVLQPSPPHIRTKRLRNGESETVPHDEIRDVTENLYRVRITLTDSPYDEVEVFNTLPGYGLFLIAIGYLPDVQEHWEIDKQRTEEVITNTWSGEGDEPVVLSPRSCYRLTVKTKAHCDPGAPRDHIYYFRTDGPPAKNLKDYVAWTVPGFQKYPLFQKYDVVIRFRTNYVDQLFPDLPLRLSLKSDSGRVTSAKLGEGLSWIEEATHLLCPEERVYIDILNASGAVDRIDPLAIPGDKSLIMTSGSDTLESDQGYTAFLDLSPESNFTIIVAQVAGVSSHFTQHLPMLVTAAPNPGTVTTGETQLLGSSEDFDDVELSTDTDSALLQFKFRTSKFHDFNAMFTHLINRQEEIQSVSISDPTALRIALDAVAHVCQNEWRPNRLALWEKQLLVRLRLAKEEELLDVMDKLADVDAQLDSAFSAALTHLPELAGLLLQPLPEKTKVYWSPICILVELPEPIEFERISVAHNAFDVLVTCSSDESCLLIFPVSSTEQFSRSGILVLTYHLNIGNDHPRLRYGSLTMERVVIELGE